MPGVHTDLQGQPPAVSDVVIVGGGLIGLALARELTIRHPRLSVCVLERESQLAAHQSSHNSGVVHSGIYYRPGSLKARLCVQGARQLFDYCERHSVRHERCGKLIIATDRRELPALEELARRGAANGVEGLRWLAHQQIPEFEPHARGLAALHSPQTAVVDFKQLALSLAADVLAAGGQIHTGCAVTDLRSRASKLTLTHGRGVTQASHAILCAGVFSDRLAIAAGAPADPRIVPFRGAYLRLAPQSAGLVRALIYPVPDPRLPFLGVHLSRVIDGDVLIGPTALLAPGRRAYRLTDVDLRDLRETITWPGSWRLAARWWPTALRELHYAAWRPALRAAAARYVPEVAQAEVSFAFAGIRAQALGRDGSLLDDFSFSFTERSLHVRNAPSPAATSSLAIAAHLADRAADVFGWVPQPARKSG